MTGSSGSGVFTSFRKFGDFTGIRNAGSQLKGSLIVLGRTFKSVGCFVNFYVWKSEMWGPTVMTIASFWVRHGLLVSFVPHLKTDTSITNEQEW